MLLVNTTFLALTIVGRIINDKVQQKGVEFCLLTLLVGWKMLLGNGVIFDLGAKEIRDIEFHVKACLK